MKRIQGIDTVILAAGSSRRLGSNKLFLTIDGEPVLRRTITPFLNLKLGAVFVVTGFQSERIEHLLKDAAVKLIQNSSHDQGMSTSVKAALPFIEPGHALLLHLGDKPFVQESTILRIAEAFSTSGQPIVMPHHEGRNGHPVLIDVDRYRDELEMLTGEAALKPVIERHAQDILYVEGDEGVLIDLDTDEDIDLLRKRGYTIEKG